MQTGIPMCLTPSQNPARESTCLRKMYSRIFWHIIVYCGMLFYTIIHSKAFRLSGAGARAR